MKNATASPTRVTDIVTQYQTISIANLNDILLAAAQLMKPFPFGRKGLVIVLPFISLRTETPIIEWQYSGGGTLTKTSQIGTTGGAADSCPTG